LNIPLENENITEQATLMINVKRELYLDEQIKSAWDNWGSAVSGFQALLAAIAGGVSSIFLNKLRRKL
jgi:hypothetical protein